MLTGFHIVAGRVLGDGVVTFRRSPERGHERVPDQPGAVPASPLPADVVRAAAVQRQVVPRARQRVGHHILLLRPRQPAGPL